MRQIVSKCYRIGGTLQEHATKIIRSLITTTILGMARKENPYPPTATYSCFYYFILLLKLRKAIRNPGRLSQLYKAQHPNIQLWLSFILNTGCKGLLAKINGKCLFFFPISLEIWKDSK
jgi:hypothetical protein